MGLFSVPLVAPRRMDMPTPWQEQSLTSCSETFFYSCVFWFPLHAVTGSRAPVWELGCCRGAWRRGFSCATCRRSEPSPPTPLPQELGQSPVHNPPSGPVVSQTDHQEITKRKWNPRWIVGFVGSFFHSKGCGTPKLKRRLNFFMWRNPKKAYLVLFECEPYSVISGSRFKPTLDRLPYSILGQDALTSTCFAT